MNSHKRNQIALWEVGLSKSQETEIIWDDVHNSITIEHCGAVEINWTPNVFHMQENKHHRYNFNNTFRENGNCNEIILISTDLE